MAEILGGEGAEVVARDERQVVVVRRAAPARGDLEQSFGNISRILANYDEFDD